MRPLQCNSKGAINPWFLKAGLIFLMGELHDDLFGGR